VVAQLPDDDPITSKSYALHYLVATVLLMATLFWALWDEAYGQRPWKEYQEVFRSRYGAFLKTARSRSAQSEKEVESSSDYQKLKQDYESANEQAKPRMTEINEKLHDLNARILSVQNVFTDKRAYVNALTYEMEKTNGASARQKKQRAALSRYFPSAFFSSAFSFFSSGINPMVIAVALPAYCFASAAISSLVTEFTSSTSERAQSRRCGCSWQFFRTRFSQ